jgi:hypothetical protein
MRITCYKTFAPRVTPQGIPSARCFRQSVLPLGYPETVVCAVAHTGTGFVGLAAMSVIAAKLAKFRKQYRDRLKR